ncbi:MAG: undecaprenyl-diphosphate phosphatase [Verrucomicrobiales bacterium]|nr:undecaprenyl-diphosphate phosphatase [Verrucomicrobiales bacterium]
MPEWVIVILLGVIEGVTEFLPVSSTGHLLLAEHWLPRQSDLFTSDLFNTVIQCGAVLALFGVFTDRIKQLIFRWKESATQDYFSKLAVAFIITGIGGVILKKLDFELPEKVAPVASATLIGGVLFLVVEYWLRQRPLSGEVTWKIAIAAGLSQLVAAVFPGTSRSGVTILAALLLGLNRPAAAEFSFLLGIPTLLAAGALQTVSALKQPGGETVPWSMILLGSATAAVTAFVVVKWLLRFVQTHTFVGFAWYRIALGILLLAFVQEESTKLPLADPTRPIPSISAQTNR